MKKKYNEKLKLKSKPRHKKIIKKYKKINNARRKAGACTRRAHLGPPWLLL